MVLAGLLGLGLVPALAQEAGYAPTMLVLDGSGSMKQGDPSGGTKMDAAKNAMHRFIDSAPPEAEVGLTVYGTRTGSSDAEKAAGCQDVRVLRPPRTVDKPALTAAVDGIRPSGYTPIGNALRAAAEALPEEGPRAIVLVSDGEDTCAPPDPCEVAKELTARGAEIVVHAVGFNVDERSRQQLTCIAQATGGTYSDAPDGRTLERILPRVSATALRTYEPAGTPIAGRPDWKHAPVADPGQYLDTLGQKETRYYAVDVPQGATAYFSGTISFPRLPDVDRLDDINSLQARVYGAGGEDCHAFASEQATMSSDGVALTIAKAWDGATEPKKGSGSSDNCRGAGRYFFALTWDRVSAGVPERLPIELLVGVEPAVTDGGSEAVLPTTTFAEPSGQGAPVVGGGSFNVAAPLDGSGRYTDTLQRGEYVFYRVWLGWGRGLAYRVHFGQAGGAGIDNVSNIATSLHNPNRTEIDSDTTVFTGSGGTLPANDTAIATAPVRYHNRDADNSNVRTQSVAGWYYIAVKLGATFDDGDNVPVPVTLDLTVAGTEESGPAYASPSGGIFGDKEPTEAAPAFVPVADKDPVTWPIWVGGATLVVLAAAVILLIRGRRP
ncbi:Ca-activated chloride channel family protein [Amycolatopsis endophytica]|uniref:Ca-activated chloride channel family protein n=1 Tax=Amycolatopsis endophytica TaxID=860233 RepID=A0A853AY66_9PSEU|nr:VWA domain-containing protein [Amycolatopsis endophytica]NYI87658.1 Ca-activated chloride channel family protein [Amycolatopsis endophytica]